MKFADLGIKKTTSILNSLSFLPDKIKKEFNIIKKDLGVESNKSTFAWIIHRVFKDYYSDYILEETTIEQNNEKIVTVDFGKLGKKNNPTSIKKTEVNENPKIIKYQKKIKAKRMFIIFDLNNYVESFKRLNLPRGYDLFTPFKTWYDTQTEDKIQIWMFYSKHLQSIVDKFPIPLVPEQLFCESKMKYNGKTADVDTNITGEMVWRIKYSNNISKMYLFSGDKDLFPIVDICQQKQISFNVMVTHQRFLSHELKNAADDVIELFPHSKTKY